MNDYICYHNGEFKKESDVCISFRDLGFQRAYGVFDYLRTYNQKPFQLEWHSKKIIFSMKAMNIESSFSVELFLQIIDALLSKNKKNINKPSEYGIKTIITGGVNRKSTIIMYMEEFDSSMYDNMRENGVSLLSQKNPRQLAEIKSIDYRALFKSQKELKEKDCLEILHRGDTYVYESGTSNIFIVKEDIIITPKDDIYLGSTRDLVIDLAHENNFRVEQRSITWEEFINADEIFITASKKEILSVVKIYDADNIFNFEFGKITKKLIQLFKIKKQDF